MMTRILCAIASASNSKQMWHVKHLRRAADGAEYPIFPFHSPDSNRHSKCCRSERDVDDAEQLWLGKSNVGFEHISDRYIVHALSSKARALHVLTKGT